jgi:hypothetical protein
MWSVPTTATSALAVPPIRPPLDGFRTHPGDAALVIDGQGMMGGAKAHYDGIVAFSLWAATINADLLAFINGK